MNLEKLSSALNQGGHHVGDLIWWTLAEARIKRPTLEQIWSGVHLLVTLSSNLHGLLSRQQFD